MSTEAGPPSGSWGSDMTSKSLIEIGQRVFVIAAGALCCLGFRYQFPGKSWNLSSAAPAMSKLFVDYSAISQSLVNDLPAGDVLSNAGAEITVATAMQSIINDFNNVQSAYVILAETSDPDYATYGADRTIILRPGSAAGLSSGEAKPSYRDKILIGCGIELEGAVFGGAKRFIKTITHEIGHCLGLAHPQETTRAVMSYFSSDDTIRLQIDDKMGLVSIYPVNPEDGQEAATYGLSCARK